MAEQAEERETTAIAPDAMNSGSGTNNNNDQIGTLQVATDADLEAARIIANSEDGKVDYAAVLAIRGLSPNMFNYANQNLDIQSLAGQVNEETVFIPNGSAAPVQATISEAPQVEAEIKVEQEAIKQEDIRKTLERPIPEGPELNAVELKNKAAAEAADSLVGVNPHEREEVRHSVRTSIAHTPIDGKAMNAGQVGEAIGKTIQSVKGDIDQAAEKSLEALRSASSAVPPGMDAAMAAARGALGAVGVRLNFDWGTGVNAREFTLGGGGGTKQPETGAAVAPGGKYA